MVLAHAKLVVSRGVHHNFAAANIFPQVSGKTLSEAPMFILSLFVSVGDEAPHVSFPFVLLSFSLDPQLFMPLQLGRSLVASTFAIKIL
jgi:hypothetical protein